MDGRRKGTPRRKRDKAAQQFGENAAPRFLELELGTVPGVVLGTVQGAMLSLERDA